MSLPLLKFNPKRLVGSWAVTLGTRDIIVPFDGGYMDDTIITASYNEDRVTEHVGADGTVTIVVNANELATVKLSLVQGNPSNEMLSQLIASARRNVLPVGVFHFEDLNGTTVIKSPEAYIKTFAEITFGNEVKGREWSFGLKDAELVAGAGGDF